MPAATDIGHGEDPRVMLGRIVYRQRMQLGISQEDLADQVGLDRTYISGIERGIRNPTFLVLLRLAQVLRVRPSLFMEADDGKGGASQ
jgi:transcriptional regulator with XRE-family HTH domain